MYNGIGLATARGTGTNGYVQKNLSFIKRVREKIEYKPLAKENVENLLLKKANQEILLHDNKRKLEIRCVEMKELMEDQGFDEEEIEEKVSMFRKMLMQTLDEGNKSGVYASKDEIVDEDNMGRPITKNSHQLIRANEQKNKLLKHAFGIKDDYIIGSAFNVLNIKKDEKDKIAHLEKIKLSTDTAMESQPNKSPPRAISEPKIIAHIKNNQKHKNKEILSIPQAISSSNSESSDSSLSTASLSSKELKKRKHKHKKHSKHHKSEIEDQTKINSRQLKQVEKSKDQDKKKHEARAEDFFGVPPETNTKNRRDEKYEKSNIEDTHYLDNKKVRSEIRKIPNASGLQDHDIFGHKNDATGDGDANRPSLNTRRKDVNSRDERMNESKLPIKYRDEKKYCSDSSNNDTNNNRRNESRLFVSKYDGKQCEKRLNHSKTVRKHERSHSNSKHRSNRGGKSNNSSSDSSSGDDNVKNEKMNRSRNQIIKHDKKGDGKKRTNNKTKRRESSSDSSS